MTTALDYGRNLLLGTRLGRSAHPAAFCSAGGALVRDLVGADAEEDEDEVAARLRAHLRRAKIRRPAEPGAPVKKNVRVLTKLFSLSPAEAAILQFLLVQQLCLGLEELTDELGRLSHTEAVRVLAAATGLERKQVFDALAPSSRLLQSGILTLDDDSRCHLEGKLALQPGLVDLIELPELDGHKLLSRFLPAAPEPEVGLDEYPHLAAQVRLCKQILGAALKSQAKGINVLLHGPTGTGKTELARALSKELGAVLYVAGAADSAGESPDAKERLGSLLLGNRLLGGTGELLVLDEAEDFFERQSLFGLSLGGRRDRLKASKQWFNSLLEDNRVPTIWITNDTGGMDPALLRRFAYSIEFRPAGPGIRRRLWKRHLGEGDAVSELDLERLAGEYEVSAGQIAKAVETARLVRGDGADAELLEALVRPGEALLTGRRSQARASGQAEPSYQLEGARASQDLERIAKAVDRWRARGNAGLSLCLYGPPGTGKSAFVHHLARRAGLKVVSKRVSDIESCWVGATETNIAEAFAEAAEEDAILLFDEADSFLRDRRQARARWEVTSANEFLQHLESHPGLVACTTNLFAELDPASLRRFTFKVAFDYLLPKQAAGLFESLLAPLCGEPLSDAERRRAFDALGRIANLAPGDFALVRKRLLALGAEPGADELVAELQAECRLKGDTARKAGFQPCER